MVTTEEKHSVDGSGGSERAGLAVESGAGQKGLEIGYRFMPNVALFIFGDQEHLVFESELYRSCPESRGTGCSKVSSQPSYYCSELWITTKSCQPMQARSPIMNGASINDKIHAGRARNNHSSYTSNSFKTSYV